MNKETRKSRNEEYDLEVGFDDTFKTIIFCLLYKKIEMIS